MSGGDALNHIIYFGDHPRPGVFKIDVRPGLALYFDEHGGTHSLASSTPIGATDLIAALGAIRRDARRAVK